jgi:hypothetical protein
VRCAVGAAGNVGGRGGQACDGLRQRASRSLNEGRGRDALDPVVVVFSMRRVAQAAVMDLLVRYVVGNLAGPLLDDLEVLLGLILEGGLGDLLLDGGGGLLVVGGKLGVGGEAGGVGGEELVQGDFELRLLEAVVSGIWLACGMTTCAV